MRQRRSTNYLAWIQDAVMRLVGVLLICSFAVPLPLLAKTFQDGYGKYARGDFKGAEASLSAAAKTAKAPAERARIFKFLGISQYMQNKKTAAQGSFRAALKIAPSTSIAANEVLDEGVIPFFQALKSPGAARTSAPATAAAARPAPSAKAPPDKPVKFTKSTYLRINSNVTNASILIDGILAGQIGSVLEVSPGTIEVQLNAPGYNSKRAKVRIAANQENTITLNLEKPAPKPKPVPKAEPKVAQTQAPARAAQGRKAPTKTKDNDFLPDPGGASLFGDKDDLGSGDDSAVSGRNLQQEFAIDGAAGYGAPPPVAPQPYAQPQPQMNPYGYQQPYAAQPYYPPQPAYPQPAYPYPTQPYAPSYPAAPYGYAPPPAVASPYSPAPPPAIPIPQDPMMTPAPASPVAPAYDTGDSNESFLPPLKKAKRKSSGPKPIPLYDKPRKKSSSSDAKSSTSGSNMLINLLPFGAGQFQRGNYLLGGAFAAAEVGALFWWYQNKSEADKATQAANEYNQSNRSNQEKEEFTKESQAYVDQRRQQQQFGLYGFIGLWVVGAGEAIYNAPKPKAKAKKRRLAEESLDQGDLVSYRLIDIDEPEASEDISTNAPSPSYVPRLSLGIMLHEGETKAASPQQSNIPTPAAGLKAEWNF